MKRIIIKGLIVMMPVVILLVSVNYFVDPANIYHSDALDKKVLSAYRSGYYITNLTNYNERQLKRHLVEDHRDDTVDFVILGSSRVLSIDEYSLPGTVLNLGVSGGTIEDFISFYQICKENNLYYSNVIIGVDPTMIADKQTDTRWRSNSDYYNRFLRKRGLFDNWFIYKNLTDVSYFQESLKFLVKNKKINHNLEEITTTKLYCNEGNTLHPDGSICYNKEYRETKQIIIDSLAINNKISPLFEGLNTISLKSKYVLLLDNLLDSLSCSNKRIYFFTCPYHPYFYNRIIQIPAVKGSVSIINEICDMYNIDMVGDYDPNLCGCNNASFYDEGHPRKETVDRLFEQYLKKE